MDDGGNVSGELTQTLVSLSSRYGIEAERLVGSTRDRLADAESRARKSTKRTVDGHVLLPDGRPAPGLKLDVYQYQAGKLPKRVTTATTDTVGFFRAEYGEKSGGAAIELRAVDADGNEIRLTAPVYGAAAHETINVVAPSSIEAVDAEYVRLMTAVSDNFGDTGVLVAATEGSDQRDLTLMSDVTGWDQRCLALAAKASRLGQFTSIDPQALYGVARLGGPTDPDVLGSMTQGQFATLLERAQQYKIVDLDNATGSVVASFNRFSATQRLSQRTAGAVSTLGETLTAAGFDDAAKATTVRVVFEQDLKGDPFFEGLENEGVDPAMVRSLRQQVRLGGITLDNAALNTSLAATAGPGLRGLATGGFYKPDAWISQIRSITAGDPAKTRAMLPPTYHTEQDDDLHLGLEAYARELARRVRVSFPAEVIAQKISANELSLGQQLEPGRAGLLDLLASDFDLSTTPVDRWLAANEASLPSPLSDEAKSAARALQRTFQLTPNDEAMQVLLAANLTTARAVASLPRDVFLNNHAGSFRNLEEAELVYRKATQIRSIALSFATDIQRIRAQTPVPSIDPTVRVGEGEGVGGATGTPTEQLIKTFPTLEALLGNLDFCECEHCHSVLSPAAYLVALLQFIDPDDQTWGELQAGGARPYDVLVQRRPDIPTIPLTCENTNTQVPYIDLANEVMESVVVGGLTAIQAGDTGDAESIELLAEPAVLHPEIMREAYEALEQAHYPIGLPFSLPVATARRLLNQFDVQYWQVLDAFADDAAMWDVFLEQINIDRSNQRVLFGTDPSPDDWHLLYGLSAASDAPGAIGNARGLARRLSVTYHELIDLVRARFVNPALVTLDPLDHLGIEASEALRYVGAPSYDPLPAEDHARIEGLLGPEGTAWVTRTFTDGTFDNAVVLRGIGPDCDLAKVTVTTATGSSAQALAGFYHRLNLFVRIRRLRPEWSIRELDAALTAFMPVGVPPWDDTWAQQLVTLSPNETAARLRTALVMTAHLDHIHRMTDQATTREELVTLWSRIPAHGRGSLYASRFLMSGDAYFDHPLGLYLSGPAEDLLAHAPAVQAGTRLTAEETRAVVEHVAGAPSVDLSTYDVDLDHVSTLLRYGLLARVLRTGVLQLVDLIRLLNLDPFPSAPSTPFAVIADDTAYAQTIEFVRLARALADAGISIEQLRDIFLENDVTNQADEFLTTLSDQMDSVTTETQELSDPANLTEDFLAQKLGLIIDSNAAATLAAMWSRTATYVHEQPINSRLPQALQQEPGISLTEDTVRGFQILRVSGVMTPVRAAGLAAYAHPDLPQILAQMTTEAVDFLNQQLGPDATGLDIELLFGPAPPPPAGSAPEQEREHAQQHDEARRTQFTPILRTVVGRRLRELRALDSAVGALNIDNPRARLFFADTVVLADPDTNDPLLESLLSAAARGCSATAFDQPDLAGAETRIETRDFAWTSTAGAASVRLEARVTVPQSGPYRIHVRDMPAGATATVTVDNQTWVASGTTTGVTDLTAGALHVVVATIQQLNGGAFRLEVEADGLPPGPASRLRLIPARAAAKVETARRLAGKAAQLAQSLNLSNRDLRLLFSRRAGHLPLTLPPPSPATPIDPILTEAIGEAVDYVVVRGRWIIANDDLVDILERARANTPLIDLAELLASSIRASAVLIEDAATRLSASPADLFTTPAGLRRLATSLGFARCTGLPISDLAEAVSTSPDASRIRNAVRARYDQAEWRNVAKPVYDDLRQLRRNALVAYLIGQLDEIETPDQLFELLLLDPGIEPVVATSRIQLAIASVQLFVQRCFLNLEPTVRPGALESHIWEWMKWYRVWEANMKIFVWPQNWLEQEFRDDKTHLFAELESSLLAEDVTNERAEAALHTYLKGLETISRLRIVTSFRQEGATPADYILHVLGCTRVHPMKYFYRSYTSAYDAWAPWEPVDVDIGESNHVLLAPWQGRLHVFWLTLFERFVESQTKPRGGDLNALAASIDFGGMRPLRRYDVSVSWSERGVDGWTEPSTSDVFDLHWNGRCGTPGLFGQPIAGWVGNDYSDINLGLRNNAFHVTYPNDDPRHRTIQLNLDTTMSRALSRLQESAMFLTAPVDADGLDLGGGSGEGEGGTITLPPDQVVEPEPWPCASGPGGVGFMFASRFEQPRLTTASLRQATPFSLIATGPPTGFHHTSGSGALVARYATEIRPDGSQPKITDTAVLVARRRYEIIPCSNRMIARSTSGEPSEVLGGLEKPFFYQDDEHTFLVVPELRVRSFLDRDYDPGIFKPVLGAVDAPPPSMALNPLTPLDAAHAEWFAIRDDIVSRIHESSLAAPTVDGDWLTQPGTVIEYEGSLVGSGGYLADDDVLRPGGRGSLVTPVDVFDLPTDVIHLVGPSGVSLHGSVRMAHLARSPVGSTRRTISEPRGDR